MGYLHIDNLYKNQKILLFRRCYALEKIHGTSAHIGWKEGKIRFFSGGVSHEQFVSLFDEARFTDLLYALGHENLVVYGEAYGGKCQGMSKTYGKELRFIVFDIMIGKSWLCVPSASEVSERLGLDFVYYVEIPTDLEDINAERDRPSEQAFRNGCATRGDEGSYKISEGVVLRPLAEFHNSSGERIIAKHKREEFKERASIPNIDPTQREILERADLIAAEWVTDMRLAHVLDRLGNPTEFSAIPSIVVAMQEDITREAAGEIIDSKAARRAVGALTVRLYKKLVTTVSQ